MIFLFVVFFVLAVIALTPILIVLASEFEGSSIERIELVLSQYDGVIISLATLFLVSSLALLTSLLSTRSNDNREKVSWHIQTEIKLSEFRQIWINDLREELSEFSELFYEGVTEENQLRFVRLSARIRMRLNSQEPEVILLFEAIKTMNAAVFSPSTDEDEDKGIRNEAINEFVRVSQRVLKVEWDRLKGDLRVARLAEGKQQ